MPLHSITIPPEGMWRDRVAFEVRGQSRTYLDVILAALVRGDLPRLIEWSHRQHLCRDHATDSGIDLDLEAVDSDIEEFRYARDLMTVEETEIWLGERGLTVEDLTGHFIRRHWFNILDRVASPKPIAPPPATPPTWPADLILSGEFTRLARSLAGEEVSLLDQPCPTTSEAETLLATFRERMGFGTAGCAEWQTAHRIEPDRLLTLLHGQARHSAEQQAVLTDAARLQVLEEIRSGLCRVELEAIEFDDPAAAREAFLCATKDRLSMEAIAMESGFSLRCLSSFLRDLPESWRLALLPAAPGRVLRPLAGPETTSLVRVVRHVAPGLEDPAVRAEVDQTLWNRHFGEAELREIRWRTSGGNPP